MKKLFFILACFAMFAFTAVDKNHDSKRVLKMSPEAYKVSQELQLNIYTQLGLSEKDAFRALINSMEPGTPIMLPLPVGFTDPKVCCVENPADCWPYGICCWRC